MYTIEELVDRIREAYQKKGIILLNVYEKDDKVNEQLLKKHANDSEMLRHYSQICLSEAKQDIIELAQFFSETPNLNLPIAIFVDFKSEPNTIIVRIASSQQTDKIEFNAEIDDLDYIANIIYCYCSRASLIIQ